MFIQSNWTVVLNKCLNVDIVGHGQSASDFPSIAERNATQNVPIATEKSPIATQYYLHSFKILLTEVL